MEKSEYEYIHNVIDSFKNCLRRGNVPLITYRESICSKDGEIVFACDFVRLNEDGQWTLDVVPLSPFYAPEVKAVASLPSCFSYASLIYNLGFWLRDRFNTVEKTNVSHLRVIQCYERCLYKEPSNRILSFV